MEVEEKENGIGTLKDKEVHPCSPDALKYVKKFIMNNDISLIMEGMASCALSGSRVSQIVLETLTRLLTGETVSDRYLLGLAWFLYEFETKKKKKEKK